MACKAYVLVETDMGKTVAVANALREKTGVLVSDVVTGPHDIIAVIRAENQEEIAKVVINEIQTIDGVQDTTTYMVIENI